MSTQWPHLIGIDANQAAEFLQSQGMLNLLSNLSLKLHLFLFRLSNSYSNAGDGWIVAY